MFIDINVSAPKANSDPSFLTVIGGTIFFSANDGVSGTELWSTNGTGAGTGLVKDIQPLGGSSNPSTFTNVGGTLFFTADDGPTLLHGRELWKSNGTAAGTTLVRDIYPGIRPSGPFDLTANGNTLFFRADDGTHGRELWTSDGTVAGTTMVKDINPGGSSDASGFEVRPSDSIMFFSANDGGGTGVELYQSDGTAAGTFQVIDLNPGLGNSNTRELTAVGTSVFFSATDGQLGQELHEILPDSTTFGVGSVVPNSGPTAGGTSVSISGNGFTGAKGVYFGTIPATSFTVVNDSTITAITPAHIMAGPVDVTVANANLVAGSPLHLGYTYKSGPLRDAKAPQHPIEQTLTMQQLQPILREAIADWQGAGASAAQVAHLKQVQAHIALLANSYLGQDQANQIWISPNADGWGWFMDASPASNHNFPATQASPAYGKMDLLSVVDHELGHALGLEHSQDANDVMGETLAAGMRRLPSASDLFARTLEQATPLPVVDSLYFSNNAVGNRVVATLLANILAEHYQTPSTLPGNGDLAAPASIPLASKSPLPLNQGDRNRATDISMAPHFFASSTALLDQVFAAIAVQPLDHGLYLGLFRDPARRE